MVQQLLDNMRRYVNTQCTLQDLEVWVLSNLQRILDSGDEEAIYMANQVDTDLIELSEGLIDEATLRQRLGNYVSLKDTIPFTYQETAPHATVHATVAGETIRNRTEVPGPVVDLRFVGEFA